MLKQWLLPGWHVATLEQSINGDTVRRMARCCLAQEDVAASSPVTAFMARTAPSPSDPSCTLTSQKHRAVTKPEHWSEGKTLLQLLQITEASLSAISEALSPPIPGPLDQSIPLAPYLTFLPSMQG